MAKKKVAKKKVAKPKSKPETDESKLDLPSPKEVESGMTVLEALGKFKELRKYINMEGEFRTGLTKEDLAEGKKMAKQLNIKPKPAKPDKEKPKPEMPVYGEI